MAIRPTPIYKFCKGSPEEVYETLKVNGFLKRDVSRDAFINALHQCEVAYDEDLETKLEEFGGSYCGPNYSNYKVGMIKANFLNSEGKRLAGDTSAIDCGHCGKSNQSKKDVFCSECDCLLGDKSDYFFSENYCGSCGHKKEKNTFECSACQSELIRYQPGSMQKCRFCESDFPSRDNHCASCGKDCEDTLYPVKCKMCGERYLPVTDHQCSQGKSQNTKSSSFGKGSETTPAIEAIERKDVRCKECGEFYTDDYCPICKSKRGFFSKLIHGDFGLAKTYWLYGVLVGFVIGISKMFLPSFELLVAVSLGHLLYVIMITIGVWRASNKYKGKKVWAILAKIAAVLGIISLVAGLYGLLIVRGMYG